jgi:hypothetical protein
METQMAEEAQQVVTGLADVVLPSETPQVQEKVAPVEAVAEQTTAEPEADPNALITIVEPPAPVVEVGPVPAAPVENARDRAEREYHEKAQARIRHFEAQMREANKSEIKPPVKQPVASAILEQTKREMEAGKAMNAHHEALKANRPAPKLSAAEIAAAGTSTSVFRPNDYVPDPKTGAGVAASTSARPV